MRTLIRQESYKYIKQRGTQIFLIGLFIFQLLIVFCSQRYPKVISNKDAFLNNYLSDFLITFFFISISSTIISKERQFGTLRSLLYRNFSYIQIIISKIITMLIFTIIIFLSSSVVSLGFKFIFANKLDLTKAVWKAWLLTSLNNFLTLIFLMSLVILLGTLINNSNLALMTGLIGYFVINVFNQLLLGLISKFNWLKWNPLNMMNLGEQIQNHDLHQLTQLSLTQISVGYILYMSIFIILAIYSFCKKSI
ncbi:ABC transporter permease subunit [Companilactobacillus alimentarius]|uniref:ABC transporter permease subunit n=1 Tax=Companilactobacillus alimentarius TaxID=1602 RepID=UPI0028B49341|nr:ABC transporter permease subunit [Companilactobacillus alimentarius]MDT6951390.1 ABC transporter permease subunit [Companilactobacillus alimentarius]